MKSKHKNKNRVPKPPSKTPALVIKGTLLFFLFYLVNKVAEAMSIINTNDLLLKLKNLGRALSVVFKNPMPSFSSQPLLAGFAAIFIVFAAIQNQKSKKKKMRDGVEHGSAKWGTSEELSVQIDPVFENNMIFSETEFLRMSPMEKKHIKKGCNKNILVVGGSGCGKTRFFVKPNLMQMHSSYVITDPKGSILPECGKMLEMNRYDIKVLNLIDFTKSMHYNPLSYIKEQNDIDRLINTIMLNTAGDGDKGDVFTDNAEILLTALVAYVLTEAPEHEKSIGAVMDMLNEIKLSEEPGWTDAVTKQFNALEKKNPRHYGVRMYKKFKALGEDKFAQSVVGTLNSRMKSFENDNVRDLLSYDDIGIDKIGDKKTAFFVIIPDTDTTFNFIVAMMYTQMFNLLCTHADNDCDGKLPVHVRFILDEFANIGKIPMFEILISTIRSREISACIILQSKAQLKSNYKDDAETISDCCDSFLYLGGKSPTTSKEIAEMLGEETIDTRSTSENSGREKSHGMSFQRIARKLMAMNEIVTMDADKCIVQIKGCNPFFSNKFEIMEHSQYKYLSDFDKKNTFDIKKYLKKQGRVVAKANDEVLVVSL